MCPVVGFGPWLGLGKPLVEILPPGQLRGFCPLLAWLGSAVLGYGPVLSFGLVGPLLPPVISFVARILPTLACAPLAIIGDDLCPFSFFYHGQPLSLT